MTARKQETWTSGTPNSSAATSDANSSVSRTIDVRPPARDQRPHSGQRGARELAREDLVEDDPVLLVGAGGADALPQRRERPPRRDRRRPRTAAWPARRAATPSAARRRARRARRAGRLGQRESAGRCDRLRECWQRGGASPQRDGASRANYSGATRTGPSATRRSCRRTRRSTGAPIHGHGPVADGPALSDPNHDPIRLLRLGPVSQRFGSRSVPQTAQPAANGLTGSRQLGQRLRSGIAHRIARAPATPPTGQSSK